ncbi:putative ribonuclease H-like domain-containing protein [Tanacetum coccineum]
MMKHHTMKKYQTLKEEYDIWAMEMEHYLEYIDNDAWKVIQNGNSKKRISTRKDGVIRILPPVTAAEIQAVEKERKAKNILLMAIPKEHMRRFHGMDDAKEIWEAIRTRFGGNANSKKMQKAVFKQQFEAFTISSSEGLEKGYDRFQQLLSQLEAHGAEVSTEDANYKFLRSLPPAWSNLAMTMRTKPDVDTLSIDDLYNNLRVFEQEIQGASKTSSSAQNVAFVSQSKSSTNKVKSGFTGAYSTCTPSTSSTNIPEKEALAGFADEVIYSLFAKQSEDWDLLHEDLEQIDDLDIEEMDINWQIAMIAIRMKKFYKKTGRRVRVDGKTPVGFDKKKLECFNCHNTGHFARECTAKGTHDGKKKRDSFYQHQEAGKQEKNQMGLLTMDDGIVNWGEHTEDEETNHALMAISSSSEVSLCSKTCIDSYNTLKTLCDEQMNQLGDQEAQILAYSQAVKKLEAQLVTFQKQQLSLNEKLTFQANEIYEKDEKLKKYRRIRMKAVKEKEQLQKTLDSWKDSSKNLWRLINSGISSNSKVGLGYEIQSNNEVLSYEEEMIFFVFKGTEEDSVGKPLYSRFIKDNDFKGVPHPLSGDYSPIPQEEIDESFAGSIGTSSEHSVDLEFEIQEYLQKQPIKDQETPKVNRKNWNAIMERELGEGYTFTKNKCFMCGSLSHLIKDCDYYEKKMAREAEVKKQRVYNTGNGVAKPVWTNANRVNHSNKFVPRSELNDGRTNINSVRPNINNGRTNVNPVRPNVNTGSSNVNTVRSRQPVPTKTSNSFSPQRPQGNWGSAVKTSAGYNWRNSNSNCDSGPTFIRTDHPLKNMVDRGIFDSRCSGHMTGNKDQLEDFEEFNGGSVTFGGSKGYISGKGKIRVGNLDFDSVSFVKELGHFNLFSISQICDKQHKVLFTETECLVVSSDFKMPDENQILLKVPRHHNMYSFDMKTPTPAKGFACLIAKATSDESKLWHRRLGHINFKNLNKLVKGNLVRGLPSKVFKNDHTCVACHKGKQHRASCKAKLERLITEPLHTLHMDLFGPTSVKSINHASYCLVITDDCTRFSWVFFLASKDETSGILQNFIRQIENQLSHRVKIIRSDNGTEFKNRDMLEFCGNKGIKQEYSNARTPQQNGVAERMNRTLIEAARTMLADSLLPTTFWAEAVSTACYIFNRVRVTKPQNKTPYELLFGHKPIISYIRPFGCHVTILDTLSVLGKFDGKSDEGFLVGYSLNSKAYRVYNLVTKRVEVNLHVNFLEDKHNVKGVGYSTPSVNTSSQTVNTGRLDHDDSLMPDLESFTSLRQEFLMVAILWMRQDWWPKGYTKEEVLDYVEVFAPVARIEAISAFLMALWGMKRFMYHNLQFCDPDHLHWFIKVVKALFGLAPRTPRACECLKSTNGDPSCLLTMDEEAFDVDVLLYRSLIGKLLKTSHLNCCLEDLQVLRVANTNCGDYGSNLRYALTTNPTIYDSLVKQFWQTATANTNADGTLEIKATIDTIRYTISEASIRNSLQLDDATGITMLPNDELFEGMGQIGYPTDGTFTFWKSFFTPQWRYLVHHLLHCISSKSGGWDQFGSNIATALICLSTNRVYNFSKLIFDGMVANLKSKTKFLMYPRFLQMILNIQMENKHLYLAVSLTKKIFGNMKRGFRGAPRPLLPAMLLVATNPNAGQEHDAVAPSQPSSSTPPVPSTSSPPVITTPTPIPASIPTPPPIHTPTPPPIHTPTPTPTPTPIPDTEPTPFEHIYEEPSPVHQHFSPPQEQAPSQMSMEDLL